MNKIPKEDAVGVTVVLLTCAYRSQEFIRVGYYVNNEYESPELKENPPQETDFSKVSRLVFAFKRDYTLQRFLYGFKGSVSMAF